MLGGYAIFKTPILAYSGRIWFGPCNFMKASNNYPGYSPLNIASIKISNGDIWLWCPHFNIIRQTNPNYLNTLNLLYKLNIRYNKIPPTAACYVSYQGLSGVPYFCTEVNAGINGNNSISTKVIIQNAIGRKYK